MDFHKQQFRAFEKCITQNEISTNKDNFIPKCISKNDAKRVFFHEIQRKTMYRKEEKKKPFRKTLAPPMDYAELLERAAYNVAQMGDRKNKIPERLMTWKEKELLGFPVGSIERDANANKKEIFVDKKDTSEEKSIKEQNDNKNDTCSVCEQNGKNKKLVLRLSRISGSEDWELKHHSILDEVDTSSSSLRREENEKTEEEINNNIPKKKKCPEEQEENNTKKRRIDEPKENQNWNNGFKTFFSLKNQINDYEKNNTTVENKYEKTDHNEHRKNIEHKQSRSGSSTSNNSSSSDTSDSECSTNCSCTTSTGSCDELISTDFVNKNIFFEIVDNNNIDTESKFSQSIKNEIISIDKNTKLRKKANFDNFFETLNFPKLDLSEESSEDESKEEIKTKNYRNLVKETLSKKQTEIKTDRNPVTEILSNKQTETKNDRNLVIETLSNKQTETKNYRNPVTEILSNKQNDRNLITRTLSNEQIKTKKNRNLLTRILSKIQKTSNGTKVNIKSFITYDSDEQSGHISSKSDADYLKSDLFLSDSDC